MTDEIKFSGKLAKTIKIGDLKVDNQNADKELLEAIFGKKAIKDNDITLDELSIAISQLDENKDGNIDNVEIGHAITKYKQSHSNSQIDETAYAKHLKAIAEKNNALIQDQANVGNGYTIQLGEDLTDLVTRVLKSQGVKENDSDWNTKFENCKNIIIQNNPNSMKIEDGKVKWLIAGTKIYLPTDTSTSKAKKTVLDQNNQDKVIEKYQKWQNGEIESFRYKVDEAGNTYEVRSGQDDKKYGTVKGSAAERRIVSANLAKAVDVNKLRGGKITVDGEETEYSNDEVREKAQEALDILSQLEDSDNIDSVEKDEKKKRYIIHLTSGDSICVFYDNTGKITVVATAKKDERYFSADFLAKGGLLIDMDDNGIHDFEAKHGVKDFGEIEKLIKAHDSVRDVMGLAKRDFIDYDMITEGDLNGNDEETVKNKIKSATEIIAGLEISSGIKEVKLETKEDGKKEKIIKLNDGTIVKASMDKNNNITNVSVKRSGNDKVDVTFDLTDDNNKITVDLGSNKDKIEAYDAIKDFDAIKKFIKTAKTADGKPETETKTESKTKSEEKSETKTRISKDEAAKIAQRYYDIADNDSGDSSARRIRNKALAEINVNNVVEVWEASLGRGGDDSLIETITSEDISDRTGGGRDMAVQTAVHIMKQMIDRAREVGVPERFVNQLEIWAEYDYSGWINNDDNMGNGSVLPGNELTSDDDDLGDLLEPKINALVQKIKEYEKANKSFTEEDRTKMSAKDIDEYAGTLYSYVDDYKYDHGVYQIRKSVEKTVNKDNAAAIWNKCRNYKGDSSLIDMMTSEDLSDGDNYNGRTSEFGWYKKSDGTPYTGREMAVDTAKYLMTKLVERAKELEVPDYIINDVQEFIDYDFSGWIADTECLPGNIATAGDGDLDDLLEPIIDAIAEEIVKKEKA